MTASAAPGGEMVGGSAVPGSASATPAADAASGPTERELDDLARRLYDRIRLRLRRELIVDRERAGVLIDLGR
jgi:hypothetical protein